MDDLWKIWKQVSVKEGLIGLGLIMGASFVMHIIIMLASDRYSGGLLG